MLDQEIATTWARAGLVALSSVSMLIGVITYARIVGLRSFSKMSSFDFAVTVAIGSLVASTALSSSSLLDGLIAAATLLGTQFMIAFARVRTPLNRLVDNEPLLLMRDGELLEENLRRSRVTADDLRAKLREANVLNYRSVRAVVLETTGDVSVLHGDDALDPDLLRDVRT